jgi:hypothetical protein
MQRIYSVLYLLTNKYAKHKILPTGKNYYLFLFTCVYQKEEGIFTYKKYPLLIICIETN